MAIFDYTIDENGDLEFDSISRPTKLIGQDAIDQIVRNTLSLWRGNWFRDTDRGVDWLGVAKKQYNKSGIIQILSAALRKNQYIDDVIEISVRVDKENREATIVYIVKADNELVTGNEVI